MYIMIKKYTFKKGLLSIKFKRNLFLISFNLCFLVSFSQILQSENFNNLVLGNVGNSFSFPGQAGFETIGTNGFSSTTTNAGNSNFQIVEDLGGQSKSFQLTSPNGNGGNRLMWQGGLDADWNNRIAGNDVVQFEFTFNTGDATTSRSYFGMQLYDQNLNFVVGYAYSTETRELTGVAFLKNGMGVPTNLSIQLERGGLILNQNTTYTLRCSYNSITGEVLWNPDFRTNSTGVAPVLWVPNQIPYRLNFIATSQSVNFNVSPPDLGNSIATTILYNSFEIKAIAASELLSNERDVLKDNDITVFPNPAKNLLNVVSESQQIKSVEIIDLNGRIIKTKKLNSNNISIEIESIESGVYILKVNNEAGNISKKFIKK